MRPLADGDARQSAGKGRSQEKRCLERRIAQIVELLRSRPTGGALEQYRVGSEEAREHDHVGQQKDPEPIPDDDALGRRAAGAMPRRRGFCFRSWGARKE